MPARCGRVSGIPTAKRHACSDCGSGAGLRFRSGRPAAAGRVGGELEKDVLNELGYAMLAVLVIGV